MPAGALWPGAVIRQCETGGSPMGLVLGQQARDPVDVGGLQRFGTGELQTTIDAERHELY